MSKIHHFSGRMFCHTQLNASTLSPLILQKMKEDNISQLDDHGPPFCEQYMHGSCYMSLFNSNHLVSLIPPRLPQILDITQLWHHSPICVKIVKYQCISKNFALETIFPFITLKQTIFFSQLQLTNNFFTKKVTIDPDKKIMVRP